MDWIPEENPPNGGLDAKGFLNLLGRPKLDPLTVLVRETAQNSWDAKLDEVDSITFSIEGRQLGNDVTQILRDTVFIGTDWDKAIIGESEDDDSETDETRNLFQSLNDPDLFGLYINDGGTKGLGGPPSANIPDPENANDWVDFVLNVGRENSAVGAGGSYGFGKTITYIVSRCRTIIIYSRTRVQGNLESRLIACGIGEGFVDSDKVHTGRHWWGKSGDGNRALPIINEQADTIATKIGMRKFGEKETGTTILILDPRTRGRDPEQLMNFIADAARWNLWPKIDDHGQGKAIDMRVTHEDEEINVTDFVDHAPLNLYVEAFRFLLEKTGRENIDELEQTNLDARVARHEETWSGAGREPTGEIASLVAALQEERRNTNSIPSQDPSVKPANPFINVNNEAITSHHVALLRGAELVVEYYEPLQSEPPGRTQEWAGVFRCYEKHDDAFRSSEPPTHDTWSPEILDNSDHKTIVKSTLRRIDEHGQSLFYSPSLQGSREDASAAEIANMLGSLFPNFDGGRTETFPECNECGELKTSCICQCETCKKPKKQCVCPVPQKVIIRQDGRPLPTGTDSTAALYRVIPRSDNSTTVLEATVKVAMASASESKKDLEMGITIDPDLLIEKIRINGEETPITKGRNVTFTHKSNTAFDIDIICARSTTTVVAFDLKHVNRSEA